MKLFQWGRRRRSIPAKQVTTQSVPSPANDDRSNVSAGASASPQAVSSDVPIRVPSQDAYGIDSFAQTIAKSIANADVSEGLVFAVHGPWGSGKSSACNLVLYHLDEEIKTGSIVRVTFNPWWFHGSEALTLAFFQELGVSIAPVSQKAKEALSSLGSRLSSAGALLGGLTDLLGAAGAGSVVAGGAELLGRVTRFERTVEEEHARLSEALREQKKKFLVVIDDIDRLETDDALQVFRLVKSAGRLPNVVYLLAFDRILAEKMVSERFPSEGPSYLDKFIQGGFDLPPPDTQELREAVLRVVESVMGTPEDNRMVRFWNLFYETTAPFIRTPRDAVRLSNAVRVSWPAVKDDVDRADFLALESLRLFVPTVHAAVRGNPNMLCGTQSRENRERDQLSAQYESTFLSGTDGSERETARRALLRLFPRLSSIWSNVWHTDTEEWQRERLVCAERHFPTYFGFSVNSEAVSARELDQMLAAARNANDTAALFRQYVQQVRRRGGTRAALALEELMVRSSDIREDDVPELLRGLFSVADEIDAKADESRGLSIGNNSLRIHWLLNKLVRDRFEQPRRTEIIEYACQDAEIAWMIEISQRCYRDYEPNREQQGEQREPWVTEEAAGRLINSCRTRVREAAANGTLGLNRNLAALLFRWRELANAAEVRQWTDAQLANDDFVVSFAEKIIRETWTQGIGGFGFLGDLVSRAQRYVHLAPYEDLLDVERFRARVDELLARADLAEDRRQVLAQYKATPERNPERG